MDHVDQKMVEIEKVFAELWKRAAGNLELWGWIQKLHGLMNEKLAEKDVSHSLVRVRAEEAEANAKLYLERVHILEADISNVHHLLDSKNVPRAASDGAEYPGHDRLLFYMSCVEKRLGDRRKVLKEVSERVADLQKVVDCGDFS